MGLDDKIQLFEDKRIRTAWDEEKEEWYFSIVDVVAVLTDAPDYQAARNYWKVTKNRHTKQSPSSVGWQKWDGNALRKRLIRS